MIEFNTSVRDLVEYTLRKGNIDFQYTGRSRGALGTKLHQKIQKEYSESDQAEVFISNIFFYDAFEITLNGRIDGVLSQNGEIIIDEIKSTKMSLEEILEDFNELHWAQGMVYAFLYAKENELSDIQVQLTYCNIETKEIKRFRRCFKYFDLKEYVLESLLHKYIGWALKVNDYQKNRDKSIASMDFPYKDYRKGQRKLVVSIYKTVGENKKLFINAPTGIGKTISTLFPSILRLQRGDIEKIFYLTSKNTQKEVVQNTLEDLHKKKVNIKYCSLTAKDKICFQDEVQCNPEYCKYAKGHFGRINEAVQDIFMNESAFSREKIQYYAEKHRVCPFEFSLDLSTWSDITIGDYNYIFDPRVSLKRYTEEKGNYAYLIDEAHNLVDRSREMYSCSLEKSQILTLRKSIGKEHPLYKALGKINTEFLTIKKQEDFDNKQSPTQILKELNYFMYIADPWLAEHKSDVNHYTDILAIYFEINNFLRISEYYDTNYRTIITKYKSNIIIKLLCLDTSMFISQSVSNGVAAVFFSATLLPLPYFVELLGGNIEEDYYMGIESPFDQENMGLIIYSQIRTTYKHRENTYNQISTCIYNLSQWKKGNYLVFFPSYEYMQRVYEVYEQTFLKSKTIIQSKMMSEDERIQFLNHFHKDNDIIAFAVLGGIFSESIDLLGDRLVGTNIVSVGLPKICLERNMIKDYYQEKNDMGFLYAYTYPGFNKVMQAVGRVIRSEEDKGVVVLMDERYIYKSYQKLFPKHWKHYKVVKNVEEMNKELEQFWNNSP